MSLLLDLNLELIQEMNNLQAQGKGGAQNAAQAESYRSKGLPDTMASNEYLQTMCRLHANLGYLCAQQTDMQIKAGVKSPHPPSYMRAPPNMPQLEEKYASLRQLFPGWTGRDGPALAGAPAPAPAPGQNAAGMMMNVGHGVTGPA